MKDFYYILGTDANCSFDEIKEAYRKLSKKFHPDLNQGDAYFESRFKEIQEAYETLIDPGRRLVYDSALKKSKSTPPPNENYTRQSPPKTKTYQAKASAFTKPGKRMGAGMRIVLILMVVIIGIYSIEYLMHSKKAVVNHASTFKTVVLKSHKHHKRRHSLKNKADSVLSKPDSDIKIYNTAKIVPVTPPVIKPVPPVKPAPAKFVQVSNKISNNSNYLYATYVIPNATKVINMRESNLFTSAIIDKIPANSKVFVLEKGDAYYKVQFNNSTGYVPKWCLQEK